MHVTRHTSHVTRQIRELCDGRFENHIKTGAFPPHFATIRKKCNAKPAVISYIKTAADKERKLELWRELRQVQPLILLLVFGSI